MSGARGTQSTRYVAFLRGINLGKRRIEMARLRELFEQLKLDDVETFIASGNVIFSSRERDIQKLESRIATHLEKALGYDVDTFVRTMTAVEAIAGYPAFGGGDGTETIHVAFMHEPLERAKEVALAGIRTPDDQFHVISAEYFWLCRIRTSDSLVWKLPEMKRLALPSATMRNITSVRKLVAKHGSSERR